MSTPPGPPEGPQPLWYRALEPLRSEAAMFNVLIAVIVLALIGGAIKLLVG